MSIFSLPRSGMILLLLLAAVSVGGQELGRFVRENNLDTAWQQSADGEASSVKVPEFHSYAQQMASRRAATPSVFADPERPVDPKKEPSVPESIDAILKAAQARGIARPGLNKLRKLSKTFDPERLPEVKLALEPYHKRRAKFLQHLQSVKNKKFSLVEAGARMNSPRADENLIEEQTRQVMSLRKANGYTDQEETDPSLPKFDPHYREMSPFGDELPPASLVQQLGSDLANPLGVSQSNYVQNYLKKHAKKRPAQTAHKPILLEGDSQLIVGRPSFSGSEPPMQLPPRELPRRAQGRFVSRRVVSLTRGGARPRRASSPVLLSTQETAHARTQTRTRAKAKGRARARAARAARPPTPLSKRRPQREAPAHAQAQAQTSTHGAAPGASLIASSSQAGLAVSSQMAQLISAAKGLGPRIKGSTITITITNPADVLGVGRNAPAAPLTANDVASAAAGIIDSAAPPNIIIQQQQQQQQQESITQRSLGSLVEVASQATQQQQQQQQQLSQTPLDLSPLTASTQELEEMEAERAFTPEMEKKEEQESAALESITSY